MTTEYTNYVCGFCGTQIAHSMEHRCEARDKHWRSMWAHMTDPDFCVKPDVPELTKLMRETVLDCLHWKEVVERLAEIVKANQLPREKWEPIIREIAREEIRAAGIGVDVKEPGPVTIPVTIAGRTPEEWNKLREELSLRDVDNTRTVDRICARSRDAALEEAARVCDGKDNYVYLPEYWNAMKDMALEIRSLKSQPAPAQPDPYYRYRDPITGALTDMRPQPAQPSAEKALCSYEDASVEEKLRRQISLAEHWRSEVQAFHDENATLTKERDDLRAKIAKSESALEFVNRARLSAEKALDEIAEHWTKDKFPFVEPAPWIASILQRTGRLGGKEGK